MLDRDACRLYELFAAERGAGGRWHAGSGAVFDLRSNAPAARGLDQRRRRRPADPARASRATTRSPAAAIDHALRFTAPRTRRAYVHPARHAASRSSRSGAAADGAARAAQGARSPLAGFGPQARAVLVALKRYGMILADNGSPWYVTGAPSAGWDDDDLHDLGRITRRATSRWWTPGGLRNR